VLNIATQNIIKSIIKSDINNNKDLKAIKAIKEKENIQTINIYTNNSKLYFITSSY
jgi:hypothetical protein